MSLAGYVVTVIVVLVAVWFLIAFRRSGQQLARDFDNLGLSAVNLHLQNLIESREPGAYLLFEE